MLKTATAALVILASSAASADEAMWGFGARVGGYGFREAAEDGGTSWEDCKMNGLGLFAQRTVGRHVFLEGGLDQYNAESPVEMDRVSTIASVAGGLRMFPGSWISLHVQLGAGLELTRVSMHEHDPQTDVLPMGFLGFGADARIVRALRVGLNVRMNGMGHYDHPHQAPGGEMEVTPELASQGQIYLRYDL